MSEEQKENIRIKLTGMKASEQTRMKLSIMRRGKGLGKDNSMYGKGYKISGPKHGLWKQEGIGRMGIHKWIRRNKPKPEFCEKCRVVPPFELHNISGKYSRDFDNWLWLCQKCHTAVDEEVGRIIRDTQTGRFIKRGVLS